MVNIRIGKKNGSAYFLVDLLECLKNKVHQAEGFNSDILAHSKHFSLLTKDRRTIERRDSRRQ